MNKVYVVMWGPEIEKIFRNKEDAEKYFVSWIKRKFEPLEKSDIDREFIFDDEEDESINTMFYKIPKKDEYYFRPNITYEELLSISKSPSIEESTLE